MEIFKSIKNAVLGDCEEEDKSFDREILMHINSGLATLSQNGAGKPGTILTTEDATTYEDLFPPEIIGWVDQYLYIHVKRLFDNSTTASFVLECLKEQEQEALWRIREELEGSEKDDPDESSS